MTSRPREATVRRHPFGLLATIALSLAAGVGAGLACYFWLAGMGWK